MSINNLPASVQALIGNHHVTDFMTTLQRQMAESFARDMDQQIFRSIQYEPFRVERRTSFPSDGLQPPVIKESFEISSFKDIAEKDTREWTPEETLYLMKNYKPTIGDMHRLAEKMPAGMAELANSFVAAKREANEDAKQLRDMYTKTLSEVGEVTELRQNGFFLKYNNLSLRDMDAELDPNEIAGYQARINGVERIIPVAALNDISFLEGDG